MELSKIIALLDRVVEDRFNEYKQEIENSLSFKPRRGPRGLPGQDFDFKDNENEIINIISSQIEKRKSEYKLKFQDLTPEEIDQIKIRYEDLSDEDKLSIKGPRGFRGQKGKGFELDEYRAEIEEILLNLFDLKKPDLKLTFQDLSDADKNELRLRFKDLTESQKEELRGERGEKGPRGQRGKEGPEGEVGPQGVQGEVGPRGPQGIQGLPGPQGLTGIQGKKGDPGKSASQIIDIKISKWSKDRISFIFTFDDGTTIETNAVELPPAINIIQSMITAGGGGGTIVAFDEDVELGEFAKINFKGPNIQATLTDDQLDVEVTNIPTENDYCIDVTDEGNKVTDCLKSIDFCGEFVEATTQTVMSDWATLTDVEPDIASYEASNPGQVKVCIDVPQPLVKQEGTGSPGSNLAGDTVPLTDFISIKYFVAIKTLVSGLVMSFELRVNNQNNVLSSTTFAKLGKVKVDVTPIVVGSNMVLDVVNNETEDVDVKIYRLNY